jgi:hypothetical protein
VPQTAFSEHIVVGRKDGNVVAAFKNRGPEILVRLQTGRAIEIVACDRGLHANVLHSAHLKSDNQPYVPNCVVPRLSLTRLQMCEVFLWLTTGPVAPIRPSSKDALNKSLPSNSVNPRLRVEQLSSERDAAEKRKSCAQENGNHGGCL